jgi:hypothetical protein
MNRTGSLKHCNGKSAKSHPSLDRASPMMSRRHQSQSMQQSRQDPHCVCSATETKQEDAISGLVVILVGPFRIGSGRDVHGEMSNQI